MFDDIIKPKKKKKNEITEKHWMAGMTGFRLPKEKTQVEREIDREILKKVKKLAAAGS